MAWRYTLGAHMARSLEPVRPPGVRTPGFLGQAAARTSAGEVIRRVSPGDIVLEDYRPLPLNLEWRGHQLNRRTGAQESFA
jgi:hypothetical protein